MVGVYDSSERLLGAHESSGAKFGKGKSGVSSCHHKVRHFVAKRVVSREPALRFTRCRLLGSFLPTKASRTIMALVIREGDPTTTGGIVVAGSSTHTVEFRKAARISDPVWRPACKSMGFIAEGNPTVIDEHLALATEGHAVKCGCPFGSNRLIATQGSVVAGAGASIGIAPDLAARAEAATEVWARAIREGSYTSQFTADIPTHAVRGLASSQCVFAKSCGVPRGSTTAGTAVEPADSFGRIALLGTVEQKGPVVASDRGAAVSTLLLALWPSNLGDGTLYSEHELG